MPGDYQIVKVHSKNHTNEARICPSTLFISEKSEEDYKILIRALYYGSNNLGVLLEEKSITVNEILKCPFHFADNTK